MKHNKIPAGTVIMYTVLIILTLISLFPIYYVVVSSTNTSNDINQGSVFFGLNLLNNAKTLFSNHNVLRAMSNSFRNALSITVCTLVICSLAGYGFEIYHDSVKDKVMTLVMMTIMIPFVAIMVPLYRTFSNLNLLNTLWCVLLPSIFSPVMIMLFRNSSRAFPHELIDAARIDGESEIGIFTKIYVPTMKSTYAAAAVMTFMNAWNNFMWIKVSQTSPKAQTMTVMVSTMMGDGQQVDYGELMLALLISILPVAIVFICAQKYYVEGVSGSVKG